MADLTSNLTEQIDKFEKLDGEMDKLKDSHNNLAAACKLNDQLIDAQSKLIDELKAENAAMKFKLKEINGFVQQIANIAAPFSNVNQEEIASGGFAVGDRVVITRSDHKLFGNKGKVAFLGELEDSSRRWAGIILDDPVGTLNYQL